MTEIADGLKMIDSRVIALYAAKRNFDPAKERKLIEKSLKSKCRCKHWTQTNPCLYRNCRHIAPNHYGVVLVGDKPKFTKEELEAAK